MSIDKDQTWRRKENGTMELVKEIEVEREKDNQPTTEDRLQMAEDTLMYLLMGGL